MDGFIENGNVLMLFMYRNTSRKRYNKTEWISSRHLHKETDLERHQNIITCMCTHVAIEGRRDTECRTKRQQEKRIEQSFSKTFC